MNEEQRTDFFHAPNGFGEPTSASMPPKDLEPSAPTLPNCEPIPAPAPAATPEAVKPKKPEKETKNGKKTAGSIVVLVFLVLLLSAGIYFIYLHSYFAIADSSTVRDHIGDFTAGLFSSVFPMILTFLTAFLLIILLFIIWRKAPRFSFLYMGLAFAFTAAAQLLLGIFSGRLVHFLPASLESILTGTYNAYRSLTEISAYILAAAAALMLCIFACITVRKGRKEK